MLKKNKVHKMFGKKYKMIEKKKTKNNLFGRKNLKNQISFILESTLYTDRLDC
jgi:hypothetical protein